MLLAFRNSCTASSKRKSLDSIFILAAELSLLTSGLINKLTDSLLNSNSAASSVRGCTFIASRSSVTFPSSSGGDNAGMMLGSMLPATYGKGSSSSISSSSSSPASRRSSVSIKSLILGDIASIKDLLALSSAISFSFFTSAKASSYNCFDMYQTSLILINYSILYELFDRTFTLFKIFA